MRLPISWRSSTATSCGDSVPVVDCLHRAFGFKHLSLHGNGQRCTASRQWDSLRRLAIQSRYCTVSDRLIPWPSYCRSIYTNEYGRSTAACSQHSRYLQRSLTVLYGLGPKTAGCLVFRPSLALPFFSHNLRAVNVNEFGTSLILK